MRITLVGFVTWLSIVQAQTAFISYLQEGCSSHNREWQEAQKSIGDLVHNTSSSLSS